MCTERGWPLPVMLTTYAVPGSHAFVQAVPLACDALPSMLLGKCRHPFFTVLLKHHLPCEDFPDPSHDPVKHRWVLLPLRSQLQEAS